MKIKKISIGLICTFVQVTYAAPDFDPITCPSVDSIQQVGVSNLNQVGSKQWIARQNSSTYFTTQLWTFMIGRINAQNTNEALTIANRSLNHLEILEAYILSSFDPPIYVCDYRSDEMTAIAFTPSDTNKWFYSKFK